MVLLVGLKDAETMKFTGRCHPVEIEQIQCPYYETTKSAISTRMFVVSEWSSWRSECRRNHEVHSRCHSVETTNTPCSVLYFYPFNSVFPFRSHMSIDESFLYSEVSGRRAAMSAGTSLSRLWKWFFSRWMRAAWSSIPSFVLHRRRQ